MLRYLAGLIVSVLPILCLGAPESGKSQGWFLITEHNGVYEGSIVKMFLTPDDPPNPICTKCSGDQKDQPWLGLTIIKGMMRKGLDYEGGTILDPRYGSTWGAEMHLSPDGQDLTVRGFALISALGMNQYWKRLPDCAYAQLDPSIMARFKLTAPKPGAPGTAAKGRQPAVC